MTMRKLAFATLVAATLGAAALPAAARTNVDLHVNLGAPVYYEPVPAPRMGYVWVPGYWDTRGYRQHWVAGHWTRARPGYAYLTPGRYRSRDMDRDGVPNRYDRDVDGDGVANRYDRAPGNPYRH